MKGKETKRKENKRNEQNNNAPIPTERNESTQHYFQKSSKIRPQFNLAPY